MTVTPARVVLAAENLGKEFPGVRALDGVSFDVRAGEIHALCGENGAGKSTLIKTLSGIHPHGSYDGRVLVDGSEVALRGVADALAAGIAVINQELALVDDLTVAENIFLGREPTRHGIIDPVALLRAGREALARRRVAIDPTTRTGDLGTGQQQLVEITKALSRDPRVLILDEPTAALTETEVAVLMDVLKEVRAAGCAVVYISHRLDEVFALADRITVLRDGRSVITMTRTEATRDDLIRHMVGRAITDLYPRRAATPGPVLLSVEGLSVDGPDRTLREVSFTVAAGEVLGIGGLMGAGRSELLLHLMGAWGRRRAGRVQVGGADWAPADPAQAWAGGLALVVEDRKRHGLVLDQGVSFNLSLADLGRRRAIIDSEAEASRNQDLVTALRIKIAHLDVAVGTLSGGNQQKVLLGKALATGPRVVLLDEPTRGIDVGAKQEVYGLINRLSADGKAVVLVSSELPELLGMSDRILMLAGGRAGGTFTTAEASQERLLAAAIPEARA